VFRQADVHPGPDVSPRESVTQHPAGEQRPRSALVSSRARARAREHGESITRKVSQLTNQIRRDIKKTNDPAEMGADKCVLFSPDLPLSRAPATQRARA